MTAEHGECEIEHEAGAFDEGAGAPELVGDCESPFGVAEVRLERPNLEQPDRDVRGSRHDRGADVLAGGAPAVRPADEPLEPVECRRRRGNEPGDFVGRQRHEQRRRVGQPQLAQRHHRSGQRRQSCPPIGRRRNRTGQRYRRDDGLDRDRVLVGHLLHYRVPAMVELPHTMLSPVKQRRMTVLPEAMLSRFDEPQTMLSPFQVPHTMLSPTNVPHTMLSPFIEPQTMLSPFEDPHTMLSPFIWPMTRSLQTMLAPHTASLPQTMFEART